MTHSHGSLPAMKDRKLIGTFAVTQIFWGDESKTGFQIPHDNFLKVVQFARQLEAIDRPYDLERVFEIHGLDADTKWSWESLSDPERNEFLEALRKSL